MSKSAQHSNFSYALPTEDKERWRLDTQHRCITLICGGLYYPSNLVESVLSTPLPTGHAIVDIGTGSGAWAEDMARAFPEADVLGVDLTPPKSTASTPPNCRFRFEDANRGFSHYGKRYSVAHMRMISNGVDDFRGALHNVGEILNPGGVLLVGSAHLNIWGEDRTPIRMVKEGETGWCAIRAIQNTFGDLIKNRFEIDMNRQWVEWLRDDDMYEAATAGDEVFYIPIGPWSSDLRRHSSSEIESGRLLRENFAKLIPIWVDVITKAGAVDSDTLDRWLRAAKVEMNEMNPPLYAGVLMTWAKRSEKEWTEAT